MLRENKMYVVINAINGAVPERAIPSISEGTALLNFLRCLGYDPANPPLGDLLRQIHGLEGDWLIASPVYWQASHNDALIMGTGKDLELQESETKAWFDLFANYFTEDGLSLYYHDPETWLLQDYKKRPLTAKPVHQLLSKSLMPELARLDNTLFWQRFITESQMLFASKPNALAANGLWLWGNARLADKTALAICADPAFLPFAKLCSTNVTLYNSAVTLKDQHILLISEFSVLSEQHQNDLKKRPVHWYWNNMAYTCCQDNWFIRLWRKLIHAN